MQKTVTNMAATACCENSQSLSQRYSCQLKHMHMIVSSSAPQKNQISMLSQHTENDAQES